MSRRRDTHVLMSRHSNNRRKRGGASHPPASQGASKGGLTARLERLISPSVMRRWKKGLGWPGRARRSWRALRAAWKILTSVVGAIAAVITVWLFVVPLFRSEPPSLSITAVTNTADFNSRAPYVPEYLFPEAARDIPAPPDRTATASELYGATAAAGRWSWAHRLGAVDAENTLVHLVLTRSGSRRSR